MNLFFLENKDKNADIVVRRLINLDLMVCISVIRDELVIGFKDRDVPLILDFNEPSSQELWNYLQTKGLNQITIRKQNTNESDRPTGASINRHDID
ncbi:MAG: hypothetical protein QNJ63_06510 [Calothrix sp. MO_192.B10]|nr:hypothetical protein [Calothrix sp. MO_192.B10]